jgi:hypothetical protein
MRKKNARPLYIGRRHAVAAGRVASPLTWLAEVSCGSRGIAINVAQTAEAMQRRQSLARLRRRIGRIAARRARRNVRQTRADVSERPRRCIQGAYLGQVCVSADDPITLRRAAREGARRIFGQSGRKRSSSSVCVAPLEMPLVRAV